MSTSIQQAASSLKSLHLLRALLREASYLPDATARRYFRQHVLHQYKAYQPKQNATASFGVQAVDKYRHRSFRRRQTAIIAERTRPLLRKGQKGLNFLRRANQGETPCLLKVLFFAYGRTGRRKYALLDSLLRPDPLMDSNAEPVPAMEGPTPLQLLYHSNKRYLQYFDAPKATSKTHYTINISDRYSRLRTVIKSQYQKGLSLHRDLKGPALKTPINNVWERSMPIKRASNNVRRWYAETLTRLLPPIPNAEWDNMHAMMVGEKWISLKRRRVPGVQVSSTKPILEEQRSTNIMQAAFALDKPSRADKPAGMQRPHTINPKFMRRFYAKVLALCCKLEYDHDHKRWKAIWGEAQKGFNHRAYTRAVDESLFAGVDATGHIPSAPKKTDVEATPTIKPLNAKGEYVRFPFFAEHLPQSHPMRKELDDWKRKRAAAAGSETTSESELAPATGR